MEFHRRYSLPHSHVWLRDMGRVDAVGTGTSPTQERTQEKLRTFSLRLLLTLAARLDLGVRA